MIFVKEDILLVVKVLKFECLVERSFLVYLVVYVFYFRVLCCDKEEKVENIGWFYEVVKECDGIKYNYRYFNMLGYCYYEVEFYEEVCMCYLVFFF